MHWLLNAILYSIQKPKQTLFACIGFLFLLGAGLQYLFFEGDYRIWFNPGSDYIQAIDTMENTYSKSDNIILVVTSNEGDIYTQENLIAIASITNDAWKMPYSTRVDSITNYQYSFSERGDLMVMDLYDPDDTLFTPDQVKTIARNEPTLMSRLVSDAPDVTGINVTLSIPLADQSQAYADIARFARTLKANVEAEHPSLSVGITGFAMLNHSFNESALEDMVTLVPAMLGIIFLALALIQRSLKEAGLIMIVLFFTLLMLQGIAGWLGISINSATANTTTLILTLSVADCIHIFNSFHSQYRRKEDKTKALRYAISSNFMPLLITSLTTSVGFLTLNFSNSPPIRSFGNIVAIGMIVAFVVAVVLLPCLIQLCSILPSKQSRDRIAPAVNCLIRYRRPLFFGCSLLMLGLITALPKNHVNNDLVQYFSSKTEFRQTTDYFAEKISGLTTIEYSIVAGEAGGISEPEFIQTVADFTAWLRLQPETNHVYSLSDTFKRLNMNIHDDNLAYYKLPQQRELAAQYLLLYELSLPFGLDLTNQVNLDKSATRVIATFENIGSAKTVALEVRSRAWLEQHAPKYQTKIASAALMFSHVGENNMTAMLYASVLSLIIISALVGISLRSWRLGAVLLVPTILPAAAGFGLWGIINGEVNMGISMVCSMTFGIIVDFCVHIASRYSQQIKAGETSIAALQYAYSKVLVPISVTTVVLCAGFSILLMSNFKFNSGMGAVTTIVIVLALLTNLFILPQLLIWFGNSSRQNEMRLNSLRG